MCSSQFDLNGEPVTLEVTVSWADAKQTAIRVRGTAFGPSHWRLERTEEAITVQLLTVWGCKLEPDLSVRSAMRQQVNRSFFDSTLVVETSNAA